MEIEVNKETLEKEIQRVFKKLPNIVCDANSLIYIINALDAKFEQDFKCRISTNY